MNDVIIKIIRDHKTFQAPETLYLLLLATNITSIFDFCFQLGAYFSR